MSKWICPDCESRLRIVRPKDKPEFIGCSNYRGGCKYTRALATYIPQLPKKKMSTSQKRLLRVKGFMQDYPSTKLTKEQLLLKTKKQLNALRKVNVINKSAKLLQREETKANKMRMFLRRKTPRLAKHLTK